MSDEQGHEQQYDEVADALGIPPFDEDDPGEDQAQEAAGAEKEEPVQESSGESGDDAAEAEGSGTGDDGSEAPEPAEPSLKEVLAELEEMKRANSGLYSEVKSERERRKQLMEEFQNRASEEQAAKKKAEAEAGLPDKDEDPVGYMEAKERQLFESVEQRLERMEQARQQEAQREAFNQAVATVNADEEHFRQQKADYDDALSYARNERARILRASHPEETVYDEVTKKEMPREEWVALAIQRGDRMFAMQSLQRGISPAARAYDYATRLGYKPGEPGNGGQAAPAAAPAPAPAGQAKPAEKPKQTSLSAAAGRSGGRGRKLTMEEAVELPDAEFDAVFQDPVRSQELSNQGYTFV